MNQKIRKSESCITHKKSLNLISVYDHFLNPAMEEPTYYEHALDDLLISSSGKQSKALAHFNYFLESYCRQIGVNVVKAEEIPYRGITDEPNPTNKAIYEFWDNMIGAFFTYMGTAAMCNLNPKGRRLAYQSATQYCSSVKVYFTNRFRIETPIPVFHEHHWKKLRENLRGRYREGSRASGTRIVEGKTPSTREDREAMATGCIWLGTAESAEFWHLLNTSYHCSGRGSEVSLVTVDATSVVEVREDVYQYSILQTEIQRQKGGPYQTIPIYPHRDGILEDFYFSMVYLTVMTGCENKYVFPMFSDAALKTTSNKSDSKVSSLWTKLFDELNNTFAELSVHINEKLSSHCNKKGSNQVMADCPSVSGLAQIFRTGWELRGCDTLFEYICGSFVMSQQAGKAVSGWTAKVGDIILGGQPTTFSDIEGDTSKLKQFTDILFEDDKSENWDPKVRELLVMALLLRFDQFLDVFESNPDIKLKVSGDTCLRDRFSGDHLFICRVKKALDRAQVGEVQFDGWISESRSAFMSRNIPGIPIEKFPLYGGKGDQIMMDPRCFVDHFNVLASVTQNINVNVQRLQHMVNDIRRNQQSERLLGSIMYEDFHRVMKSVERLEKYVVGHTKEVPSTPTQHDVIRFSISSKALTNRMSLTDVTIAFFVDNYETGFILDKKSDMWGDLDLSERKRLRNLFFTIKRAVRMVLMHADAYPEKPECITDYKEVVRKIAQPAEERIRNELGFGKKTISIYKLTSHPSIKTLEKSLKLPENTPEHANKFFKID